MACWEQPEREFQYFAMALVGQHLDLVKRNDFHLYHHMITNHSWWDTVDMVSSHGVGNHLSRFPDLQDELHKQWLHSENMWLQRTMMLYQLKYKSKTDTGRLRANILHCCTSDEFFIQKAIGWALREYSKTDATWVEKFIRTHELKPLSRREGMKWLEKRRNNNAINYPDN
jgi:3-methyladenine DNA glycosylase AlkD